MTEEKKPAERVFAFWTYVTFPLRSVRRRASNRTERHATGRFRSLGMTGMFTFQPVEMGTATKAKLQSLEAEYRREQAALLEKFKAKALEVLPALAMTKPYGGNFR